MPSNSPTVPTVPQMPMPSITPASFSDERIDSSRITNDEGGGRSNPLPTMRDTASSSSSFSNFQNNISSMDMSTGIPAEFVSNMFYSLGTTTKHRLE